MVKRVIIDADTGIDDALAILYALKSPYIRVEGITTCFGNSTARQSAENSIRVVKLACCNYEVPVAVGANQSLEGVFETAPAFIHGDNGLGNVELPKSSQTPIKESAHDFIIRKANELNGELILITTGRLTNLALALQKDSGLPGKIKKVITMGGNIDVPGNTTPYAEANIYGDALAADLVFKAGFRLTLVGLDVTLKTLLTLQDIDYLCRYSTPECKPIAAFIKDIFTFYFEFHRVVLGMAESGIIHDALAVLIAEDPSLGEYKMLRAGAEYQSQEFKGMIKQDKRFMPVLDREEIAACVRVDHEKAVRRLLAVFQDRTPGKYNQK